MRNVIGLPDIFFINALLKCICIFFAIRDRGRTTVNVLGDAMGTGIVEHLSRVDLKYRATDCDKIPSDKHRKKDNADVILYSSNV